MLTNSVKAHLPEVVRNCASTDLTSDHRGQAEIHAYICLTDVHITLSTMAPSTSSDLAALAKSMWQRGRKSEQLCVMCSRVIIFCRNHHFWLDVLVLSQVYLRYNYHKFKLDVLFSQVQRVRFWYCLGYLVRFWAHHPSLWSSPILMLSYSRE